MQDIQATLSVGMLIRERYEVKRLVGESQSGAVYQVVDNRAKMPGEHMFALKEIVGLSEQERYQLTFDSVQLGNIHHEALPRIHHVFNDDRRNCVCIVMEYVAGPDLETIRQQQPEQRLTWPEVAKNMASIVDAVSYLHRQEPPIVHNDIKPANILFVPREERFMLVDIAIAREQHIDASVSLAISGYKGSAQTGKAVDVRADVYGFGATCYTMLTGVVPPNVSIRTAHFDQTQADLLQPANSVVPAVPSHVAHAINRSMSLDVDERFSSIEEFWQALQVPSKEFTLAVGNNFLPIATLMPVVPEQTLVLADVQKPDFSKGIIKNKVPFFFLKRRAVPLLLLLLFLLVGSGTATWMFAQSHHAPSIAVKHAGTTSSALTTPVSSHTAPIVTPTSFLGSYPGMVGSYAGTLADIPGNVSTTMILQGVHQIEGTINGYLTVGSPFEISGSFRGAIDFSKHFQLIVSDAAGHPILFLEGAIQSATSISGDYYRCASLPAQDGKCLRASDNYGIWSALLATSAG